MQNLSPAQLHQNSVVGSNSTPPYDQILTPPGTIVQNEPLTQTPLAAPDTHPPSASSAAGNDQLVAQRQPLPVEAQALPSSVKQLMPRNLCDFQQMEDFRKGLLAIQSSATDQLWLKAMFIPCGTRFIAVQDLSPQIAVENGLKGIAVALNKVQEAASCSGSPIHVQVFSLQDLQQVREIEHESGREARYFKALHQWKSLYKTLRIAISLLVGITAGKIAFDALWRANYSSIIQAAQNFLDNAVLIIDGLEAEQALRQLLNNTQNIYGITLHSIAPSLTAYKD